MENGFGFCIAKCLPSSSHLPRLQRVDRINQHQNLKQQAVSDPNQQNQLGGDKYNDASFEAESLRDHKPGDAGENVAEGIEDRVTVVTQGESLLAVTLNYKFGIFEYLPGSF